jgi:hypothetical protein
MANNPGTFVKKTSSKYLELDNCLKIFQTAPNQIIKIHSKSFQIQMDSNFAQTTFG